MLNMNMLNIILGNDLKVEVSVLTNVYFPPNLLCFSVMLWKVFTSLSPGVVQKASSQPQTNLHLFNVLYVDLVSYVSIYISFPQGFIHQYIYIYSYTDIYKLFILILPLDNTTLNMFYTAVPWSRSFARASRFLKKSCLVGEGSIEGFSLVFSLYSDPLDLKSQHTDKVQVDLVLIVFKYFIYPNCFAIVKQLPPRSGIIFTSPEFHDSGHV